jgi:hypothetical protein
MVSIASNLTQRNYRWSQWKAVYAIKGLPFQYEDDGDTYTIWTYDHPDVHITQIWKGTIPLETGGYTQEQNDLDRTDFEATYKSLGNAALEQIDTDGAQIVRQKAAKRGWTFAAIPVEFCTSRLQSDETFYSKTSDGVNRAGISLKIYNADNVEITTQGLLNANLNTAVKTVIDFEPTYDIEIIGGVLRTISEISADIRLWIIVVPDVPAMFGGSREIGGGVNLNYLVPSNTVAVDGRVSKTLKYDAVFHTNKVRFIFKYPAGTAENMMLTIDLYRP